MLDFVQFRTGIVRNLLASSVTPASGVGTTARYYRHGPGLPPLALVLAEYYRLGSTTPCPPLRNTE